MNHYHVKYFVDAASKNSVAEAARLNFVTHPAVSQAIRTLESELNVKLLTHQKRRFELTTEGEMFFEKAKAWLEQLTSIKDSLQSEGRELTGELVVAGAQSLTAEFIASAIFELRKSHPKLTLRYSFGEASVIRNLVRNRQASLGFLIDDHRIDEFECDCLGEGDFVVVSRKPREKIGARDLIVTNDQKVEVMDLFKNLDKKKLPRPKVFLQLVSWSLIRRFVLKGDVHGYVPDYVVREELKSGDLYRVDTGVKPFRYSVKAIWRKGTKLPRAAEAYLDLICPDRD